MTRDWQDSQASQKALASEVTNLQAAMKKQAVCWETAECVGVQMVIWVGGGKMWYSGTL